MIVIIDVKKKNPSYHGVSRAEPSRAMRRDGGDERKERWTSRGKDENFVRCQVGRHVKIHVSIFFKRDLTRGPAVVPC